MPAKIEIQKNITPTGIRVYSFHGELDNLNVDDTFTQILQDIGSMKGKKIIFNLIGLKHINSKWLWWIAEVGSDKLEFWEKLILCCVPDDILDVFDISGLKNIVDIYKSENSAYTAFLE